MTENPTLYVVDDDPDVRHSLTLLLEMSGYAVRGFSSAATFLASDFRALAGCLIADIRMPDMDGLELQDELRRRQIALPVIVITGHGDVPLAVRAMKAGAVNFLEKPFREEVLLESVKSALEIGRRSAPPPDLETANRLDTLTDREREVMLLVVVGQTNKEIARTLNISPRTVDIHRARVMEKMQAATLADLIRMTLRAQGASGGPA